MSNQAASASAHNQPYTALFGRSGSNTNPLVARAEGVRVWDTDGREYIDACSGAISVISIGHGIEEVIEAMAAQARQFAYVHGAQLRHEVGEQLAQELTAFAPASLNRAFFVSGGSEANESAIKLARQYQVLRGHPERSVILSRRRSYHGGTIATLSLSGYEVRRANFNPLLLWEPAVAECYCYRCPFGLTYPACDIACADDLERAIVEAGAERVAAFVAEPIVAAAGPGMTPPAGYFARIRAICDHYDILFIADEVVTGIGRTGLNFGIEHWGVEPDVIVTAKGLSGGYVPLGALLIADRVAAAFEDAGAVFTHGYTYMEHPVTCAAGLAVLRVIERDRLVENAANQGAYLFERLDDLAERNRLIGDIRGKGLLAGIELVADQGSRQGLDPSLGVTRRLIELTRANGLLVYPGQSGDGTASDQFIISPPLVVSRSAIDEIVERLSRALDTLAGELRV